MTANYIERPEPIPETPPEPVRRPQTPAEPPTPARDTAKPDFYALRDQKVHDKLKSIAPSATDEELDRLAARASIGEAPKAIVDAHTGAVTEAWKEAENAQKAEANRTDFEPFMPLGTDWCDEPFPVDALPAWGADYVTAAARSAQVPIEMTGPTFLGALATATRGNVVVRVSDDYTEPGVLWIGLVASSGERKSQLVRLTMNPIYEFEQTVNKDLAALINRDAAHMTSLNAEVTLAENALKNKTMTTDQRYAAQATLAEATQRRNQYEPQLPVKLIADDATPEIIVGLLAANKGAISVISTEGNMFSIIAGRYSDKPFIEVFLKAHAGDPIKVDRVGRTPQHITNPRLNMTIAIQPSVLAEIGQNKTLRGNGFIARILFSYPRPTAGTRTFRSESIPPVVKARYNFRVDELGRGFATLDEPLEFALSPEAFDEIEAFFKTIEPQIAPGGELSHMSDWASKLTGATIRIAGLLHAAENGLEGSTLIDGETMANAVRIALFFLAHGKTAQNVMTGHENAADAQHVIDWAQRQGITRFTVSEFKNKSARNWDDERVEAALQTLVNHGYARVMHPAEYAKTVGRGSSAMLELRPDLPKTD